MIEYSSTVLQNVLHGFYPNMNDIKYINQEAMRLLNTDPLNKDDVSILNNLIQISNILYNNTDRNILPLEDGIYDLLVEKLKQYMDYQISSPPVVFQNMEGGDSSDSSYLDGELEDPLYPEVDPNFISNSLFINKEELLMEPPLDHNLYSQYRVIPSDITLTKMNKSIPHKYPNLVGTLDKCKFVLNSEAVEKGVINDPTVKTFERDFLGKHAMEGLFNPNAPIDLICELKNDGVSVEADVTDHIISARTRGDTDADVAGDLTPLLGGIKFPYAPYIPEEESFGMKFEAIITKENLYNLCELRKIKYANCRVAIIGLLGSSDAYAYRNFITLVPLQTSLDIDRLTELEFMNKYYNMGVYNRYAVIHGQNYNDALFQVYRFVKEAEAIRDLVPYMYDGVVVSYLDKNIRERLGRKGAINQYQIAIKFNALKRQTVLTGCSFTVGQNGIVTPMAHYLPVEFFGSIHEKSSLHSYARFKELGLRTNDIIEIEYTNDVMPYATKVDCEQNRKNTNPVIEFPAICPSCGSHLFFTDKSASCGNMMCPDRQIARMDNMFKKLNLKDFSEQRFRMLETYNLSELIDLCMNNKDKIYSLLGNVNGQKLIDRVQSMFFNPIDDYKLFGSIGFSNISIETWRKILLRVKYEDILYQNSNTLLGELQRVNGIGITTAKTIIDERAYFQRDIEKVKSLGTIVSSYVGDQLVNRFQIRFTGCRDSQLEMDLGKYKLIDISGSSGVTKNTNILLVPHVGFSSTKINKVGDACKVIPIDVFKANPFAYIDQKYLQN